MAMGIYRGVSNVARKVTKLYRGVSNVARQVKKGYRGVSNVARQFYNSEFNVLTEWTSSNWSATTNKSGSYSITSSQITLSTIAHYQSYVVLASNVFDITSYTTLTVSGDFGSSSGGDGAYLISSSVSPALEPETYDLYLGRVDGTTKTFNVSSLTGNKRLVLSSAPNYPSGNIKADSQYYTSIIFS